MKNRGEHVAVKPDEIAEMKRLRSEGVKPYVIAEMVGRSRGVVSKFTAGKENQDEMFVVDQQNWLI